MQAITLPEHVEVRNVVWWNGAFRVLYVTGSWIPGITADERAEIRNAMMLGQPVQYDHYRYGRTGGWMVPERVGVTDGQDPWEILLEENTRYASTLLAHKDGELLVYSNEIFMDKTGTVVDRYNLFPQERERAFSTHSTSELREYGRLGAAEYKRIKSMLLPASMRRSVTVGGVTYATGNDAYKLHHAMIGRAMTPDEQRRNKKGEYIRFQPGVAEWFKFHTAAVKHLCVSPDETTMAVMTSRSVVVVDLS